MISNFRHVLNVVFFLLNDFPAVWLKISWTILKEELAQTILSQTFSRINTPTISTQLLFLLTPPMKMEQSVPKRRHIKFRRPENHTKERTQQNYLCLPI